VIVLAGVGCIALAWVSGHSMRYRYPPIRIINTDHNIESQTYVKWCRKAMHLIQAKAKTNRSVLCRTPELLQWF
jgi:hypothetical protein